MRTAIALLLVFAGWGCGGGEEGPPPSPCGPTQAEVLRAIDGDTIELTTGERIRYILVDTPESTNGATDCYGHEASAFNDSLVTGQTITIDYDEPTCTDRFGRLLAYVSVDGRDVNSLLVERGFGCVLYIPPAGTSRHNEFESLEATARAEGRGVWGACSVVTCDN